MSKILEMRQKRAEVWDKARAFLDEHTNESGVMSAEDSQQYERMEQEVVDLGHTIERMERAEQMDREMNEPVRQPLASRPEKSPGGRTGRASDEYKLAFWNMIRNRGEHFQVRNALQIGTDSEGGFLCPDEYEHTLVQALTEENQLRSLCTIIRTESGDRQDPHRCQPRNRQLGGGRRPDPRIRRRFRSDFHRRAQGGNHDQGV